MRSLVVVVVAVVALACGAAQGQPRAAPASIALLPAHGRSTGLDVLSRFDAALRAEAERRAKAELLRESQTNARLDAAASRGLACDREAEACLVQLGIVLGVDAVLAAAVSPAEPEGVWLELRRVDVAAAREERRAVLMASLDARADDVKALFDALEAPAATATALLVEGTPAGARVVVDGEGAGQLPLAASIAGLAAGSHEVRVEAEGFLVAAQHVVVRRGEVTRVELQLEPAPPPPPEPPPAPFASPAAMPAAAPATTTTLPWAAVGAGVATTLLAVVALAVGAVPLAGYGLRAAELASLEDELAADPEALDARAADVVATRAALEGDVAAWEGWGQPLAVVGAAGMALGAGVALAGAAWLATSGAPAE